jgi:hypothetical protein
LFFVVEESYMAAVVTTVFSISSGLLELFRADHAELCNDLFLLTAHFFWTSE